MDSGGIYIDDAGTPGVESKSDFLPEDRKSFCAVIIPDRVVDHLNGGMKILLDGIKQDYGADEVHCTEIYSGKGPWKGVDVAERIQVFDFMSTFMETFDLPVLYQTWSKSFASDHPSLADMQMREGVWWDIHNVGHMALLKLCYNISKEFRIMQEEYPEDFPNALPTFVDEGLAKAGAVIELPNWGNAIKNEQLHFVKSSDDPGVQLADFAAFCIARSQWISARQDPGTTLSEADIHILNSCGKLNHWSLQRMTVDPETFSRDVYESVLIQDRENKGLSGKPKK